MEGPATLRVLQDPAGVVHASAWGPGADWVLASVPGLPGADDDVSGFEPIHPLVADAWRRRPHARFGRNGLVMQTLIPSIIQSTRSTRRITLFS